MTELICTSNNFMIDWISTSTGFKPEAYKFALDEIAQQRREPYFRWQKMRGDVDDRGCDVGGVAGHAGLFSGSVNENLAIIMQMLLNGGEYNGHRYIKEETIKLFTSYNSSISRRGLGFDKPEKTAGKARLIPADQLPRSLSVIQVLQAPVFGQILDTTLSSFF